MVRIATGCRAVGHEGTRPAEEQAQQAGTQMRLGGGFVLQPRHHRGPAGRAADGGWVRSYLRACDDHRRLHSDAFLFAWTSCTAQLKVNLGKSPDTDH